MAHRIHEVRYRQLGSPSAPNIPTRSNSALFEMNGKRHTAYSKGPELEPVIDALQVSVSEFCHLHRRI